MNQQNSETYRLGPLPWSDEVLIEAFGADWLGAYEKIKEHPGFAAQEGLDAIQLALDVFLDNTDDLFSVALDFKKDVQQPGFFSRGNRANLEKWDRKLRKHLFSLATSAFALVDVYRCVTREFQIEGYDEQKKAFFVRSELHHFVQDLRNCFSHTLILTPSWQLYLTEDQNLTQLILAKKQLQQFRNWTAPAKSFIQKYPAGVDIEAVTADYKKVVREFHSWFRNGFVAAYGDQIQEYVTYEKVLRGQDWKNHWRLILNYSIENQLNPYDYLHKYLTSDEIEQISTLPYRSKEQVDLIIAKADEFWICNDEIRLKVYKLFGITEES